MGGYSRLLQGYETEYGKSDIDIVILPEYRNKVLELGLIGIIKEQFFPYPILEQFVVCYNDEYFLDVFVSEREIDWILIDGIKCATIHDNVIHYNDNLQKKNHEYFHNKLKKYENLKRHSGII